MKPGKPSGCVLFLAMAGAVFAQQATPSQQPSVTADDSQTYRLQVTSQNVVLDVVVNDKNQRNVKGLTRDDFQVFEDKKPQAITSFDEVVGRASAVAPVVVNSTAELDRLEPEAPVIIVVIDELTTKFEDMSFARYSLKKYLKAQGDTLDQPTMLVTANYKNIAVLRDYTTSRKEILEALDHHMADYAALLSRGQNPIWQAEQINATFGSLMGVAEATAGHHGHKNMIWIGRGFPPIDTTLLSMDSDVAFEEQLATCTRLLRDSRVTLYAIDPRGISALAPTGNAYDHWGDDPFGGQVDFDAIAVSTGGKVLHGQNDVDRMIDESVRDGENFYTLAYRPTKTSDNPKAFRKIRVVMRDPELRASTREGYFVANAPVDPMKDAKGRYSERMLFDLSMAVGSLLVYDGIPLTVTRDGATPNNFVLHMKAGDLPLEAESAGRMKAVLTVITVTYDRRGKMLEHHARSLTVGINAAGSASEPDRRPLVVPVSISTAAPVARVRFVVRGDASGKVGAENYFLVDRSMIADPASGADARRK